MAPFHVQAGSVVFPHFFMFSVFMSCCRSPLDKYLPHICLSHDFTQGCVAELDTEIDARRLCSSFYRAAKLEQPLAVPVTTSF